MHLPPCGLGGSWRPSPSAFSTARQALGTQRLSHWEPNGLLPLSLLSLTLGPALAHAPLISWTEDQPWYLWTHAGPCLLLLDTWEQFCLPWWASFPCLCCLTTPTWNQLPGNILEFKIYTYTKNLWPKPGRWYSSPHPHKVLESKVRVTRDSLHNWASESRMFWTLEGYMLPNIANTLCYTYIRYYMIFSAWPGNIQSSKIIFLPQNIMA